MAPALAEEPLGFGDSVSKDPFNRLVAELSKSVGPSSGLDSSDVDVAELERLMEGYVSCEKDWEKYAFEDHSRGYTRNLVDEGNGKSNLLILVWSPGKGSYVHDHANAHCIMRILKGTLLETRYSVLINSQSPLKPGPLEVISSKTYSEGQVTYMSDNLGVHRISNQDPNNVAVSLHLYTPPNAARDGCNTFDLKTGASTHVEQNNFFSRFGKRSKL